MALPAVEKLPLLSKKSSADRSVGIKLSFVTDPHAAFGAWQGCEVVGGGMNYDANDRSLEWFAEEVRRQYKIIESPPNPSFQPMTLVCDEFTNEAGRFRAAGEFFQSALSDISKAKMFGLIVSHIRTVAGLANAAGMAKLRDEALLEVELLGQQCPKTGDAVPDVLSGGQAPGYATKQEIRTYALTKYLDCEYREQR